MTIIQQQQDEELHQQWLIQERSDWVADYEKEEAKRDTFAAQLNSNLQGHDMPKVSQMIESKYLRKEDLDGGAVIVTIQSFTSGNIAQEDEPEENKWMCKFKEFKKPLVLNATNIHLLEQICGSDNTDDWVGKEVVLYVDPNVSFGNKLVGGIRVKSAAPDAAPKRITNDESEGDIPF